MSALKRILYSTAVALLCLALPAAASAKAPVWRLSTSSEPTNLVPGSNEGVYFVVATNVGSETTSGQITITDTLPEDLSVDLTPPGPTVFTVSPGGGSFNCLTALQTVTCTGEGTIHPGYWLRLQIPVDVAASPGPGPHVNESEVFGGGAEAAAKASTPTTLSSATPPFDFLPGEEGFSAPLIQADGSPATEAGSHPYSGILAVAFPTIAPGDLSTGAGLTAAGHLRDLEFDFPAGLIGDPAATPRRCTEAELTTDEPGCPAASAVGTVTIKTVAGSLIKPDTVPLYNMVPPPGSPAVFGFDALGVGVFPHSIARLRTASDYGVSATTRDILARGLNPILDVTTELWGDPSAEEHDLIRGDEVEDQPDAFLTLPTECSGNPLRFETFVDSWEEPAPLFEERQADYESASLDGLNPALITGCEGLKFEPAVTARPTTNVTESPTGLKADVFQPQDTSKGGRSTAALKDASVTLPLGLELDAAAADGLAVCDPAQIGMLSAVGESPAHFSAQPPSCPDAAKVGEAEFSSPLLGQYDETGTILQRDPETGAVIPEPLHGSVFIAKPFENPFESLLAIYLTVEDPKTGIFAKLAGEVEPDPLTGQLTTRFEENPQIPLEHARVSLFGGPRASLQTPPACGPHTTTSEFVPWSFPATPLATPHDAFSLAAAPGGGGCPASAAGAPNATTLRAGTLDPTAGAFSALVAKVSRPDGSQRLGGLELTFPLGLTGKLAGIAQCSEAQIAQAQSRSHPNDGALELASPSCPGSSQVGVLDVAAGAGPLPFHIGGRLYLAGPYKGAPLSFVAITPAIAGPFDLGAVVVRIPAYLDPTSAQVRTVTDPLPRILQGIPVDVRSVAVKADRPGFTLNPTSCEPKAFGGSVTSQLGGVAPISQGFQVGDCGSLKYAPKLSVHLSGPTNRGGHPSFRAVFKARPGDANTARVSFALPRSEFIDQAHFRTICTRVQFAANQCPPGAVYGHVRAFSPLVDYPLEGPVYLRSSSHELPDAVAVLKGPSSQPIEIDLDGRVDSVNGGIRTRIETVPDAPVTKAIITLQGAKKGLFQNSTNICKGAHRATLELTAQNGALRTLHPKVNADCGAKGRAKRGGHR